MRFNSVKNVRVRGTLLPFVIVAHATEPIPIRGDFTTAKNFQLKLSEDCIFLGPGCYSVKPFDIVVTSSKLVLYKLSTVLCLEGNPLVHINREEDYGVLSSNVNFSANLTYADPIVTKP
jgi:hypothetical protein